MGKKKKRLFKGDIFKREFARGRTDLRYTLDMQQAHKDHCASCDYFGPTHIGDDNYVVVGFCQEPQPNVRGEKGFVHPIVEHHWRCGKHKENFNHWMYHDLWLELIEDYRR